MEVSVVVTVLNEAESIVQLLSALASQSKLPSEVIVVDGGSSDQTVALATRAARAERGKLSIKILRCVGNRSTGRNAGIARAKHPWIAITDAGCSPLPAWLSELVKQQQKTNAKVIAGYYTARANTPFECAVAPYALVMPDAVNPNDFLPATRSLLLHKSAWEAVGGFDESLSDNEDYVFARALRARHLPMTFTASAVVVWHPRRTLSAFNWMIFRFARGDARAGIVRPKVMLIFARYLFGGGVAAYLLATGRALTCAVLVATAVAVYAGWAMYKNIRFARQGWYWLPILQICSDLAVMAGSAAGLWQRLNSR